MRNIKIIIDFKYTRIKGYAYTLKPIYRDNITPVSL